MNVLKNGTFAVGAPGSVARKRAEIEDEMYLATKTELGLAELDAEVFAKAVEKAKRWAKKAYGSAVLSEYVAETGGSVACYYTETLEKPDGKNTFNRGKS